MVPTLCRADGDQLYGMAIDSSGNVYVAGFTLLGEADCVKFGPASPVSALILSGRTCSAPHKKAPHRCGAG